MVNDGNRRPLRVAIFSGNYNCVKDGANQALDLLIGRMLARGIALRVYSPVVRKAAFRGHTTPVPIPSIPIPGRSEYRLALGLPRHARDDLAAFAPDLIHLAAPDWLGHAAKKWGLGRGIPVVASVHTRFETYFDYYGLGFVRRRVERLLRDFYCDLTEIYTPTDKLAAILRAEGYAERIGVWSRGVDHDVFRPEARDCGWRQSLGIAPDTLVVGFVGRIVLEKGLRVVADTMAELTRRRVPHHLLVVGDGPARARFAARVPEASFTGFLGGADLARAYASFDVFLNPSITETFGNVTLEAMASGVPPVGADALGSNSLIEDGASGRLVEPGNAHAFADAIEAYVRDPDLRLRHGRESLRRAAAHNWDAINDRLIDRYLVLANHMEKARVAAI